MFNPIEMAKSDIEYLKAQNKTKFEKLFGLVGIKNNKRIETVSPLVIVAAVTFRVPYTSKVITVFHHSAVSGVKSFIKDLTTYSETLDSITSENAKSVLGGLKSGQLGAERILYQLLCMPDLIIAANIFVEKQLNTWFSALDFSSITALKEPFNINSSDKEIKKEIINGRIPDTLLKIAQSTNTKSNTQDDINEFVLKIIDSIVQERSVSD